MNEVMLRPLRNWDIRRTAKNLVWSAASQLTLHGLYTWDLEHHWLNITEHEMVLPHLGPGFDGARVAHLTDLHIGPRVREGHLLKIFEIVNRQNVDFVVITGDFITVSSRYYARKLKGVLSELQPKVAKLAVLGNHDYGIFHPAQRDVRGLGRFMIDQLEAGGCHALVNEPRSFFRNNSVVHFLGIGELWSDDYAPQRAFEAVPAGHPIIALVHNPDAALDLTEYGARYVLAGHTHGKAISSHKLSQMLWPARYRQFVSGEYPLGDRRYVYVNRGIGPSRRRRRQHRPEISIFTLRNDPHVKPIEGLIRADMDRPICVY